LGVRVRATEAFSRHSMTASGLQSECKACLKEKRQSKAVPGPTVSEKLCVRCQEVQPAASFSRNPQVG
jgi:hypothetical protein